MTITKFPNGISSMGIPVIGGGGYLTTGSVFFVDSATGSNGNSGEDKDHPFSTIDYAVGRCTANKGDIIFVMPGHTETVTEAAGLDLDVAGISVIGLGNAQNRPAINLTTATTADIDIGANDVTLKNVRIDLTGKDAIANGIDVDYRGFTLEDCDILFSDSTGQAIACITIAPGLNNLTFRNNFIHGTAGASGSQVCTSGITFDASASACDFLTIEHNRIQGWFLTACINATAAGENWLIQHNHCVNYSDTGAMVVEFGTTAAENFGTLAYNTYAAGDTVAFTAMVTGAHTGDLSNFENYCVAITTDQSGALCPDVTADLA